MEEPHVEALATARWRVGAALSAVMVVRYFGFLGLVPWGRGIMAHRMAPGITVGIVLGAFVIVASWLLTWVYVRWCAQHHDGEVDRLAWRPWERRAHLGAGSAPAQH